jgi:heat shock protein 1/8
MTKDNNLLGTVRTRRHPPRPPRCPPDRGHLRHRRQRHPERVLAQDKSTGNVKAITITNDKGRLSKEDVERLVREAEQHKEADELVVKKIQAKNELEQYAYQIKHTVNDEKLKDKITEDEKKTILDLVQAAEQWIASNANANVPEFEAKKKELETAFNPIVTKLYAQGGQGGPGGAGGFPGGFPGGAGGFPGGAGAGAQGGSQGPKIDEVD